MEFTRGDTYKFKFQRKDANGEVITLAPDAIYFTVKRSKDAKDAVLQKKKSDMIFDLDGTIHVCIEAEDTAFLEYGTYFYDIEVTINGVGGYVQTIAKGPLTLTDESTWSANKGNE